MITTQEQRSGLVTLEGSSVGVRIRYYKEVSLQV